MTADLGFAQSELGLLAAADIAKIYQGVQTLGAKRLRFEADWQLIEQTPGVYTWTSLDAAVNPAAGFGVEPLVMLSGGTHAPSWASPAGYAAFCGAVANRYGPLAYELMNEMNSQGFFTQGVAEYVVYLKAAHAAIKAAQPNATVVSGGIAADGSGFFTMDSVEFVREMYANGAQGSFDALGYHPYSINAGTFAYEEPTLKQQFIADCDAIHAVMQANDDGNKKIWVTEYGFDTVSMSQAQQAAWLAEEFADLQAKPFIGPIFVYDYYDAAADSTTNSADALGIVDHNWIPKLSYAWAKTINPTEDWAPVMNELMGVE